MSAEPARSRRIDGSPRRALVTGARGGIGQAIVAQLRDADYEVVTMDVVEDVDICVDLDGDELPTNLLDDFDICVSNAGIVDTMSPAHRMSEEKWRRDLEVNLTGSFRVVQACLGGMRRRRYGRIVLTSSVAAVAGLRGQVSYAASKAGLIGMAKTIAAENVALGITVNCVLPGVIATPKTLSLPAEVVEHVKPRMMPSGRYGEPSEVAALVGFLCSEQAGYITAQSILIDGGSHLLNVSLGSPGRED
jgi:NAD(P)-dependent dehydrogenase (short-subunit alcohol dehydrogenase family)